MGTRKKQDGGKRVVGEHYVTKRRQKGRVKFRHQSGECSKKNDCRVMVVGRIKTGWGEQKGEKSEAMNGKNAGAIMKVKKKRKEKKPLGREKNKRGIVYKRANWGTRGGKELTLGGKKKRGKKKFRHRKKKKREMDKRNKSRGTEKVAQKKTRSDLWYSECGKKKGVNWISQESKLSIAWKDRKKNTPVVHGKS